MNILICDDMKIESDKLTRLLDGSGFDIKARFFTAEPTHWHLPAKTVGLTVVFWI